MIDWLNQSDRVSEAFGPTRSRGEIILKCEGDREEKAKENECERGIKASEIGSAVQCSAQC